MQLSPIESPTTLRISVVIPHLNQPEMLARCLASLKAGRRQPDEVLVVDNGSTRLPEALCAAQGARLLAEVTPGPGPARNRGIAQATGDVLAFIDADCLADPDWLAQAEQALADPAAQILGGDVRIAYVDPAHLTALEAYESIFAYRMDRYIAKMGFTGTGNLVVRREVMDRVGPFAGITVAEDMDWGQRATGMGLTIRYVPQMKVYHPARARFVELKAKWDRQIAHAFDRVRRHPLRRLAWMLRTLAMLASPLAALPEILTSDRIGGAGTRAMAFLCLVRIRLYRARVMAWLLFGGDAAELAGRWNRKPAGKTDRADGS